MSSRSLEFSENDIPSIRKRILDRSQRVGSCLIIDGAASHGYGMICIHAQGHMAHRVSCAVFNRAIKEGDVVMHSCDNPKCVEPSHLIIGTYALNNLDCRLKGRAFFQKHPEAAMENGRRGAKMRVYTHKSKMPPKLPFHKLSDDQVSQIRSLRKDGHKLQYLADKFSTSLPNVSVICSMKSRKGPLKPTDTRKDSSVLVLKSKEVREF